jgi:hypothetical protein
MHTEQVYVSNRLKLMTYSYGFQSCVILWRFVQFSCHGLPDLLPPTFCLPCCCLPVPYIEKIYDVLPNSILLSTSRLSKGLCSSLPSVTSSSILSKWPAHCSLPWLRMLKASQWYLLIVLHARIRTARCRERPIPFPHFSFFFPPPPWLCGLTRTMASSFLRFLDHTQRRTTVGRTPLDKWSARRRDVYLTTLNTDKHPCPLWDSNPQFQQVSGRRPTP